MVDFKRKLEARTRSNRIQGMTLLPHQEQVAEPVLDWIEDKTDYEYRVIAGEAGAGKTILTKYIVKEARISAKVLTAPTHKAVRVISQGLSIRTSTIQKLLGLRPNVDIERFDINNPAFAMSGKLLIPDFDLIIVDEASMVNKGLARILEKLCKQYKVKLLFVGDELQLPPVNERLSIVFRTQHLYRLDVVIRQGENNPLKQLLNISRRDVKSKGSNLIKAIYTSKDTINDNVGYRIYRRKTEGMRFSKQLIDSYTNANSIDDLRLCGHTNKNVLGWNDYIRKKIIKAENLIEDNDILTGYSTIVNEFNEAYIVNSEDYYISEVGRSVNANGLNGFIVKLQSAYNHKDTPYLFVLDHNDEDTVNLFLRQMDSIIKSIYAMPRARQGAGWSKLFYKDFKDKIILMKSFYDEFDNLIIKKDLDYAYTLTVHKTQGSTYNDVYVNVLDILYNKYNRPVKDINIRNRLLYVALSRASDVAHLLI